MSRDPGVPGRGRRARPRCVPALGEIGASSHLTELPQPARARTAIACNRHQKVQRILRDQGRLTCRHGFTMAASPLPFLEMVSVVPLVVWPNSPVCTYAKSVPNRDLFTGRASGQPCPEGPPVARPPEAVGATHHSEQSNAWSVSSSHACCGEYHNQPALSVSCPERHHAPELRSRELPASVKTRSGCWNTTRLHSRCDHPAATHASWVAPPALSTSPAREEPTTVYAGGSEARQ